MTIFNKGRKQIASRKGHFNSRRRFQSVDRFIPRRLSNAATSTPPSSATTNSTASLVLGTGDENYGELLRSNTPATSRILNLTSGRNDSSGRTVIRGSKALALSLWGSFGQQAFLATTSKKASKRRSFQSKPISVLDAPSIVNNYYMNLLSWNPQSDVLAVALGKSVFLWNRRSRVVTRLMSTTQTGDAAGNYFGDLYGAATPTISSVSWGSGSLLSVATEKGEVLLYDAIRGSKVSSYCDDHGESSVNVLAWNDKMLSSGGRSSHIVNRDIRMPTRSVVSRLSHGHVCGLKWSPEGGVRNTLASGGNDNTVRLWDAAQTNRARHTLAEHTAAVKAIAWSPHQHGLLATGGGTSDGHIRFWNSLSGDLVQAVEGNSSLYTGSQVCALEWSRHTKQLLSSQGFGCDRSCTNQNSLCLWSYPTMTKLYSWDNEGRGTDMVVSPEGTAVAVSDPEHECIRLFNAFQPGTKITPPHKDRFGRYKPMAIR